jgi:hypothetical protein
VDDELHVGDRVAHRVPHEVERIDALGHRVIERRDLLRDALGEDRRIGDGALRLDLHARLVLPARLADTQAVDQPVLADDLKNRLVVDLLLLRVDDDLHVAHVAQRLLVARDDNHARPLGHHPRHDRLDRRVAERDEQLRAPLLSAPRQNAVLVAVGRRGVAEVREAPVELVELLRLVAEALVLGLGQPVGALHDLDERAIVVVQRGVAHSIAASSTCSRAGAKES